MFWNNFVSEVYLKLVQFHHYVFQVKINKLLEKVSNCGILNALILGKSDVFLGGQLLVEGYAELNKSGLVYP